MSGDSILRRIERLAEIYTPAQKCGSCYGHAYALVFVPDGVDESASEWNPTHCRECGIPLRTVRRILGISEEEMYGPDRESGVARYGTPGAL